MQTYLSHMEISIKCILGFGLLHLFTEAKDRRRQPYQKSILELLMNFQNTTLHAEIIEIIH